MPDMSFVCMYEFILFYVILCQKPIVPNVNVYFFLGIKLHNKHLIWSQRDWPCSSVMLMETSKLTPMVTTHFICRKDIYIKVAMGG